MPEDHRSSRAAEIFRQLRAQIAPQSGPDETPDDTAPAAPRAHPPPDAEGVPPHGHTVKPGDTPRAWTPPPPPPASFDEVQAASAPVPLPGAALPLPESEVRTDPAPLLPTADASNGPAQSFDTRLEAFRGADGPQGRDLAEPAWLGPEATPPSGPDATGTAGLELSTTSAGPGDRVIASATSDPSGVSEQPRSYGTSEPDVVKLDVAEDRRTPGQPGDTEPSLLARKAPLLTSDRASCPPQADEVGAASVNATASAPASSAAVTAPLDPPETLGAGARPAGPWSGARSAVGLAIRPAHPGSLHSLPRRLAVANQKGGVGKTTTAVNLGAALAELGYRVLVVDLDPQGNATTGLGINARSLEASIYDVILHDVPVEDVVEATTLRNLFVVPATIDLAGAEIELVPAFSRELRLRRALDAADGDYEYTLIDCPPSLGLLTVNGLAAATEVLVPIQCEYYALEGLSQLLSNVDLVRVSLNPGLEVSTIVLTMYDARTRLADQVVRDVRAHFGSAVCRTVVPRSVRVSEAPSFGQPVTVHDPSSRGAIAYRELAKEVSRNGTR